MTISPFIFLIIYFAALVVFIFLSIVNVYHVVRFSFMRRVSMVITSTYFVLILAVVLITLRLVSGVDWVTSWEIDLPLNGNGNEGFE